MADDKDGTVHILRSVNAVLVGIKIWVLILPEAEANFKNFIKKNWSLGKCVRAISHLKILISPSRLDAENITHTIKIGYPGNLIATAQAQHHKVINKGPCMAESVNFALTGDSVRSPDLAKCNTDDLGFSHLARRVPAPAVLNKRKRIEKQPTRTRESRGRAALEQAADQLRSAGYVLTALVISDTLPSNRIYRLKCSLMSRATITAFYDVAEL
ncbi:lysine specific demethylase 4c [Fusarium pseudocircinatum]|uniref:Lysine specific demethylase 4c n=1 Tax=Fusarium pseudocircinatum TaxID=56676 RepID=A0A8H5KUF7_9HYPO|nr:lysine specific demethylase 4c [Fusarium pseudocircinatum]